MSRHGAGLLATAALVSLVFVGCTKEVDDIPPLEVKAVEVAGMTIDHESTPGQVAYGLLRAMAEDLQAAQGGSKDEQKAAMAKVFALAAYPEVENAVLGRLNNSLAKGSPKVTSLGDDRAQRLYDYVKLWTPIAGHYLSSVSEDYDSMTDRLYEDVSEKEASVYCLLAHNVTATAPADRQEVVLKVRLVKIKAGASSFWRVARLDYPGKRAMTYFEKPASPTTTPATE